MRSSFGLALDQKVEVYTRLEATRSINITRSINFRPGDDLGDLLMVLTEKKIYFREA